MGFQGGINFSGTSRGCLDLEDGGGLEGDLEGNLLSFLELDTEVAVKISVKHTDNTILCWDHGK